MRSRRTRLAASASAALLSLAVAGCGAESTANAADSVSGGVTHVTIAKAAGKGYTQTKVDVPVQKAIRDRLPAGIRQSGKLVIGEGALPTGFPPLAFIGDDDQTITGAEPDLGRLIAAVVGLQPEVVNATWDNLFVGIDSGKTDVGLSNITDTEERKQKYDFASYREDNLGLGVVKASTLTFTGDPQALDGLKIAVSAGTNQEKILDEFDKKLKKSGGKGISVKYFADNASTWKALETGQIDAFFGPTPGLAYQISQTGDTFRSAGTYSGAGGSLQGLIAATSKKGSGLNAALVEAIDYLIDHGQYATWLKTWGLGNEAVQRSQSNPPGLPLDNQ